MVLGTAHQLHRSKFRIHTRKYNLLWAPNDLSLNTHLTLEWKFQCWFCTRFEMSGLAHFHGRDKPRLIRWQRCYDVGQHARRSVCTRMNAFFTGFLQIIEGYKLKEMRWDLGSRLIIWWVRKAVIPRLSFPGDEGAPTARWALLSAHQ